MLTAPPSKIDIGHSKIAYRRFGKGPDLLFIHGWPLNQHTWRDVAPALADEFTCHLVDLPGSGDTEWSDDAPIGVRGHVDSVARIADAIGLREYGMVAHDSGAFFARLVAAEQGERVRALVLGNTEIPGHRPFLLRLIIALGNLPGGMALLSPLFRSATLRRTRLSLGGCFADPRFVDGAFSELQIAPLFRSKRAYAGQAGLVYDWDWDVLDTLPDVHARIKAKTRFIWGAADDIWFPAHKAARMVDQLPAGADFVEIPRGRLFAHEEFASDFVRLARPFLRDAFADRAGAYEPREALLA